VLAAATVAPQDAARATRLRALPGATALRATLRLLLLAALAAVAAAPPPQRAVPAGRRLAQAPAVVPNCTNANIQVRRARVACAVLPYPRAPPQSLASAALRSSPCARARSLGFAARAASAQSRWQRYAPDANPTRRVRSS
jgi:hypothetical protein